MSSEMPQSPEPDTQLSDELRAFKNALVNALNYHEKTLGFGLVLM